MTRKKTPAPAAAASEPHPWEAAGFVPVTVKFTPDLHRRAKVFAANYRGRLLSAFVTLAVEHALDLIDDGTAPDWIVEQMGKAEAARRAAPSAGAAK